MVHCTYYIDLSKKSLYSSAVLDWFLEWNGMGLDTFFIPKTE